MIGEVIFDFSTTAYIEAVWFIAWDQTDWMAVVFQDGPESPWQARYRFRYYQDAKAFGSQDRKSTYTATAKDGTEESRLAFVNGFDMMADVITDSKRHDHSEQWKVVIQGGRVRFTRLLLQQPWCHVQVTPLPPSSGAVQ